MFETYINRRHQLAALARALYAGELSYDDFLDSVPETGDPLCEELLGMIGHEPERGGLWGLSDEEYSAYMQRVFDLIAELER